MRIMLIDHAGALQLARAAHELEVLSEPATDRRQQMAASLVALCSAARCDCTDIADEFAAAAAPFLTEEQVLEIERIAEWVGSAGSIWYLRRVLAHQLGDIVTGIAAAAPLSYRAH